MNLLKILSGFLVSLPGCVKKCIVLTVDVATCFLVTWLAFSLRYENFVEFSFSILAASLISVFIIVPIFIKYGLYRAIYRYDSLYASITLIKAVLLYSFFYIIVFVAFGVIDVPRSIGLLQPFLLFAAVSANRLLAKIILNFSFHADQKIGYGKIALIYGAGSAGQQLVSGLRKGGGIKIFGFVDDNPYLWNRLIDGLQIYPPYKIPTLLSSNSLITDIFLAMPSVGRHRRQVILNYLSDLPVHVRVLPGVSHLADGIVKVEDVRDVEIEDLLNRDPVEASQELLCKNLTGKIVMVTGAGGSIGSEICREIIAHSPKALVLFELNEFALYNINREIRYRAAMPVIPILGSVLDSNKLTRVFRKLGVQTLYHAAAYKHVPMIEMNPAAGVWNNVFGTLRTVESASLAGVETMVLVSTDKAVRPTNVMGCSKRMAELVLQAKSSLNVDATKFTMVRFGNVLGSSGSVVPLFREQIKNGGPVTVTHPEIIRYFMTIPEAAQLVIQAGAIGEGGDVMLLDMGEPVRIADLAKRMIHLSGFSHRDEANPNGDIEIQFTGLRPGEKLYEELLIGDKTFPTSHSRIMRAAENSLPWGELESLLFELEAAIKAENSDAIRSLLKKAVPEFNPQSENGDVLKERDNLVVQ